MSRFNFAFIRNGAIIAVSTAIALCVSPVAHAKDLTVGLSAAISSMDPHYHNLTPNNSLLRHIFDSLIRQDFAQNLVPGLAKSWRAVDATTWEFKLRRDVRFHDGSPFTSADVAYSFKRAPNVPNSPSSFAPYLKAITEIQTPDAYTVILKTATTYPLMPNDVATVLIVPAKLGDKVTTEDFNSGRAAIGTGPYKFAEYTPNQRVVLKTNFAYWSGEEPWSKVTFKILPSAPTRVAALLSGDVEFIEGVPTADLSGLSRNSKVALTSRISNRVIYLTLDSNRVTGSPFVFDKSGKPTAKNPLTDTRVRRALSLAIDRAAIVARIMEGSAIAAGQLLPDGSFGTSKNLKAEKQDIDAARKLLADAGYADGFALTLHGPAGRYINDDKIVQVVAQMWKRIGVDTKVETMPSAILFTRGSKLEFSAMLVGWGSETGEASSPLRALIATYDKEKGMGVSNRGRYSNADVDKLLNTALTTVDDTKRAALLAQATEVSMRDTAIIPLHFEVSNWATQRNLKYTGRADQYTFAMDIRPAK